MTEFDRPATAYTMFDRAEWAALRSNTPLTLSAPDLALLRGQNDPIVLEEVVDIFLPLSRLLNLHIAAARNLGPANAAQQLFCFPAKHGAADEFNRTAAMLMKHTNLQPD